MSGAAAQAGLGLLRLLVGKQGAQAQMASGRSSA